MTVLSLFESGQDVVLIQMVTSGQYRKNAVKQDSENAERLLEDGRYQ